MRYSIERFNQEAVCNCKKEVDGKTLQLDAYDLLILMWFSDFTHSDKIMRIEEAGKIYYWVDYQYVLDDMPFLASHLGKRPLQRHFLKMVKLGILTHYTVRKRGVFSCFGFGDNYYSLISSTRVCHEDTTLGLQSTNHRTPEYQPLGLQSTNKYPTTKDQSIKYQKRKYIKEKRPQSREDVLNLFIEKGLSEQDAQEETDAFYDFYNANGWKTSHGPVQDWRACVGTFVRNFNNRNKNQATKYGNSSLSKENQSLAERMQDPHYFDHM